MNAKTKNVLLIAVAVVGIIGWIFAISGLTYQQELEKLSYAEQEATKPRVAHSYYDDTARIPCIVAEDGKASSYKIYLGNPAEMDAGIEFTISARNADVSWDASTGFNQSSSKRLPVLAGTQFHADLSCKAAFKC